jgi:hypothetical protein
MTRHKNQKDIEKFGYIYLQTYKLDPNVYKFGDTTNYVTTHNDMRYGQYVMVIKVIKNKQKIIKRLLETDFNKLGLNISDNTKEIDLFDKKVKDLIVGYLTKYGISHRVLSKEKITKHI